MNIRRFSRHLGAFALGLCLCGVALGDVIRLKDGQVIRGQIVGFRDQQFTVLIGSGARGRRSRVMLNMEDVESIEFEAAGPDAAGAGPDAGADPGTAARTQNPPPRNSDQRPTLGTNTGGATTPRDNTPDEAANTPARPAQPAGGNSPFFPVKLRVRADNSANGWADSGLMVRRGQRLRVSATGRVSLGQGRFSTPTGLPRVFDNEKLMRNEPTGALIAVVGDDNDEFIFIGAGREFSAPRDGRLFLGVNEGNLNDNTGTYDVTIEVEAAGDGG